MSEHHIDGGNFQPRYGVDGGDPGKMAYLRNPDFQAKPFVQVRVDDRVCPGCLFPDAKPGKWPHTNDARCKRVEAA